MRRQFTQGKQRLYALEKEIRASKIAYSKTKNKAIERDFGRYDWDSEVEYGNSKTEAVNSPDIR